MNNNKQQTTRRHRVIGIDPDKQKSGFAVIENGYVVKLKSLTLCELFKELQEEFLNHSSFICVEISDFSKHNFHFRHTNYSPNFYSSLGYDVGVNHQTGRAIIEFIKFMGFKEYKEQVPLRKMWRGSNAKITHAELNKIIPIPRKRTNQEERDALLIAYVNQY